MNEIATANSRWSSFRLRALTLSALMVVASAVVGISASSAWGASSYEVHECNAGTSHSAPDARVTGAGGALQYAIRCATLTNAGGSQGWERGVVLHPTTSPNSRNARVSFDAPATTYFLNGSFRYDIGARAPCADHACWSAGAHVGIWAAGMQPTPQYDRVESWDSSCGTFCSHIHIDDGCESSCLHYTADPSGNPNEWYYDFIAIRHINVTVIDLEPPALSLGGSLFASQVAHGTPGLRIDAADRGSGVETVKVEANGVPVATPPTYCPGLPDPSYATRFRPCSDIDQTVGLDTTKTPWRDGQNTLRVCASDVATGPGVANRVCEQRTVSVDNTCQDSQGATGQAQSITAGLENPRTGQLSRTRTVRSSSPAAIRGQLTGANGPVKAASVCVYETVDGPAGIEQLLQVAKSSSTGHFGVELPSGPSRTFRVAYRYGARQVESPSMYLESSVLPSLKLTKSKLRNGRAVGFRGRIPGPDADGRAVTMQAKVGKKWRTFKQLATDANGHFKGKYRFTQTRGRVLYVFRAQVKKQGGYPYSPGASPKRKVVVHG